MRERRFPDAASHFRAATAMRPDMYEGHFKLGGAYMLAEDNLSAVKAFTEAYHRQPKDIELLMRLSEMCYRMNDYSKSAQFLAEVLMLNDRYLPALMVLPELLIRLGRVQDAIDLLRAAIPVQPTVPELWVAAGIAAQSAEDNGRARIFYQEALKLNPQSVVAKHNLENLPADTQADETKEEAAAAKEVT
jgi:tetratricopeptide (TPR) repeat protein